MAIKLTPLHSTLGAELRGVDLTRPVTHEVFAEIYTAFNRHGILVFPEQPVSDEQQLRSQPALRAARGQSELREWRSADPAGSRRFSG
jgi:alpha-ketoglutarate-dependent taurine dioxygenase